MVRGFFVGAVFDATTVTPSSSQTHRNRHLPLLPVLKNLVFFHDVSSDWFSRNSLRASVTRAASPHPSAGS
jgi:hypothetical protein